MEIKEFRYKDKDPEFQDAKWDDVYTVLCIGQGEGFSNPDERQYVINAHEPCAAFTVYKSSIDQYIEIFQWIKDNKEEN